MTQNYDAADKPRQWSEPKGQTFYGFITDFWPFTMLGVLGMWWYARLIHAIWDSIAINVGGSFNWFIGTRIGRITFIIFVGVLSIALITPRTPGPFVPGPPDR
jgi:hypothetical protein